VVISLGRSAREVETAAIPRDRAALLERERGARVFVAAI
jgi:hypothetical protein